MQITVEKVSDIKTDQKGTSGKIHYNGNEYCFVNEDPTQYVGKMLEMDINEKTSAKGNRYKVGKVIRVIEAGAAGSGNGNGHISWDDYRKMAEAAHELALKLEPDDSELRPGGENLGETIVRVDRSGARAAILNTVMIAFSNGKIVNPLADDDIPF